MVIGFDILAFLTPIVSSYIHAQLRPAQCSCITA